MQQTWLACPACDCAAHVDDQVCDTDDGVVAPDRPHADRAAAELSVVACACCVAYLTHTSHVHCDGLGPSEREAIKRLLGSRHG